MRNLTLFVAAAVYLTSGVANAAVTTYGSTDAYNCYRAAEESRSDAGAMRVCDSALGDRAMRGRDRVATYVNRGILYALRGDYELAIADYDRALALDANEPDAYLNKGLAILRRDEGGREAVELLSTAIEFGTSEEAIAYYSRGVAHELNGDIVAAYNDLRRANELAPGWDAPTRDLARFQVR